MVSHVSTLPKRKSSVDRSHRRYHHSLCIFICVWIETLSIRQTFLLGNCAAHHDETDVSFFFPLHCILFSSRTGEVSFLKYSKVLFLRPHRNNISNSNEPPDTFLPPLHPHHQKASTPGTKRESCVSCRPIIKKSTKMTW